MTSPQPHPDPVSTGNSKIDELIRQGLGRYHEGTGGDLPVIRLTKPVPDLSRILRESKL